jgi:hypothetical protein
MSLGLAAGDLFGMAWDFELSPAAVEKLDLRKFSSCREDRRRCAEQDVALITERKKDSVASFGCLVLVGL